MAEKGLSKSDLMELTGLSSRIIAKLAKNETVTTDTIARICTALSCDVADIMEMMAIFLPFFFGFSGAASGVAWAGTYCSCVFSTAAPQLGQK